MSQHSSVLEGGEVDTLITPQMKSHETYAWGPKLRVQNAELCMVVARANSRLLQCLYCLKKTKMEGGGSLGLVTDSPFLLLPGTGWKGSFLPLEVRSGL